MRWYFGRHGGLEKTRGPRGEQIPATWVARKEESIAAGEDFSALMYARLQEKETGKPVPTRKTNPGSIGD